MMHCCLFSLIPVVVSWCVVLVLVVVGHYWGWLLFVVVYCRCVLLLVVVVRRCCSALVGWFALVVGVVVRVVALVACWLQVLIMCMYPPFCFFSFFVALVVACRALSFVVVWCVFDVWFG